MAQGSIRRRQIESGRVRWDVVVDLGPDPLTGKRRQRRKTYSTRREAQAGLTAWLAEIDKGTAVDRSRQTVAEMMRYWLDTYAVHQVRPATFIRYETIVRVHIIPVLGDVPMQKLTPDRVQAFYNERLAAGVGRRTVQHCHLHLSQALDQALKLALVTRNVTDAVTPPRVMPKEMSTWDTEEIRRFLSVAGESSYGPIWIVALATGMRRGEWLGLRWQDIDFERGILSVRQTVGLLRGVPDVRPPKTRNSRREVVVQREVLAVLLDHKRRQNERRLALGSAWEDHDLIFAAANGKPINAANLKRDYDRLVQRAGVKRIRIHDLRHTHITLAIQQGANIKAVSERAGHRDISITLSTYAHVLPPQHVEVADKVGAVLFGPPNGADASRA